MTAPMEAAVRAEIKDWLAAEWDPNLSLVEWRKRLVSSGWGAPGWPATLFGRGLDPALASIVEEEMRCAGVVGVARSGARNLAIQTLLAYGSDDQKRAFLGPTLTGQYSWCQLFSEPSSGSDLAGAVTRADLKDGRWIINGQKVWTTSADHADWGLLLARTDWDVPKHNGLSFFLIDMHQPGIEVRPLRQMNGYASFNEVFLTDAEVAPEHRIGELGGGWRRAMREKMPPIQQFLADCTPGYLNNDGNVDDSTLRLTIYGGGSLEYAQILKDWHAGEGFDRDLELVGK
jgi:alkylation response protein AidB-like acyl-CoA dehydrogenase